MVLIRKAKVLFLGCALFALGVLASNADADPINVTGYNHTLRGIGSFSVQLGAAGNAGAGYLGAGEGGGGITCCVMLPNSWRADLTATVSFRSTVDGVEREIRKVVKVPEYNSKENNHLDVHFLYNGNVKVFVTRYALGHAKHPLTGKDAEMVPGVPLKIRWR